MRVIAYVLLVMIISSCNSDTKDNSNSTTKVENTLFKLLDNDSTGIHFKNVIIEDPDRSYLVFNPLYNGGGVAVGDINNDGLQDIYFTGNEVENKLYLNKGDFKFEDITQKANVGDQKGWHNGVNFIDINQDGYLDIYICRGGFVFDKSLRKNLLYINQGDLTFVESADEYGLADTGFSFHSSFFDYDKDGDLDVIVLNHPSQSFLKIPQYIMGARMGDWDSKDHLYRNDNGTFTDVTKEAGLSNNYGFALSVLTSDFNEDGYSDIYIANDYTQRDYLYYNNGNGTFTESLLDATKHISLFSMGSDFADINNDGLEDLFVSEMLPDDYKRSKTMMANMSTSHFKNMVKNGMHHQYMQNVLQLNRGGGYFSEISQLSKISKTGWSWACFLSDFDNDGLRDLFVSNGYRRDVYDKDSAKDRDKYIRDNQGKIEDLDDFFGLTPQTKTKNFAFKNKGNLTFKKMVDEWGFDKKSFSNGAAIADFDNDGDLDVVVNNIEDEAFIYKNNAEKLGNNYIQFELKGPKENHNGIGCIIKIKHGETSQSFQQKTTRGYLGSVEPIVHFGLGIVDQIDEVQVTWPDNKANIIQNIGINQRVSIDYKNAKKIKKSNVGQPMFTEVFPKGMENFKHVENTFDDFKSQILLPYELSKLGPFASVADINNDGLDDFYIGGAHNQAGSIYVQNLNGSFKNIISQSFINDSNFEDMSSVFIDIDNDNDLDLYVVSGGSEFKIGNPQYMDRLYLNNGEGRFERDLSLKDNVRSSGMTISKIDFDNDGYQDLFIGGRCIPSQYPKNPKSYLLRNNKGALENVTQQIAPELEEIGMVTSSCWEDINEDGAIDLIVVGEWMPITIFLNQNGKLVNKTNQFDLQNTTGWWNTIESSDLDGDGDTDYVIGNLGENFKYKSSSKTPFRIYSNDFDNNGTYDIVLAKYDGDNEVPIRGKQCTSEQMPFINEKFPTYTKFAEAEVKEIIDINASGTLKKDAQIFSSIILRNNNGRFEIEKLPSLAQLSTVNGIIIDDFNNDKINDIIIAGNLYDTEVETTRADASIGLLLMGQEDFSYKAVDRPISGLFLNDNVKDIDRIIINNEVHYMVASNDSKVKFVKRKEAN